MNILNFEIKIKIDNPDEIEAILKKQNARYVGKDHQIDTYFNSDSERLKLREGNIENSLILYNRVETKGIKKSEVVLQRLSAKNDGLKKILGKILGVWKVVDKQRKIFFCDNVKFHIDVVEGLGTFLEIEAIDDTGKLGEDYLKKQCEQYVELFSLDKSKFIDKSYSDLIGNQ